MARNPIIAAIIETRLNQIADHCTPQTGPYEPGFTLRAKTEEAKRDNQAQERLTEWTRNAGLPGHGIGLERLARMTMRDSLTLDAMAIEIVPNRLGFPAYLVPVDGATIRRSTASAQSASPFDDEFFQTIRDQPTAHFKAHELIFGQRHPLTDVNSGSYGLPELAYLVRTVTSLTNGDRLNAGQLTQGGTQKGILVVKGDADTLQFESFKRDFREAIRNAAAYWRPPVLRIGPDAEVDWVTLDQSNRDMEYQRLLDHLIRTACSVFLIDPTELGFQILGTGQRTNFESGQGPKVQASKDKGLKPLLSFFADQLNRKVISRLDDRFELTFTGTNANRREEAEVSKIEVETYKTVNEARAEKGLPGLPGMDVVLTGGRSPDSFVTVDEDSALPGQR